jgi:TPR repeat protein
MNYNFIGSRMLRQRAQYELENPPLRPSDDAAFPIKRTEIKGKASMRLFLAFALMMTGFMNPALAQSNEIDSVKSSTAAAPLSGAEAAYVAYIRSVAADQQINAWVDEGYKYDTGQGVSIDKSRAVQLYTDACNGGAATGCHNLGLLYYNGEGVPQNKAAAAQLFIRACDEGYADDCNHLGLTSIGDFSLATPSSAADTPLEFVQKYIHAVSSIEYIRATSEKELAAEPDSTQITLTCIRSTEALNLELLASIAIMNSTHLQTGFGADEAPQLAAGYFALKREAENELGSICASAIADESKKSGVDYGAILVNMAKITARINYIDKLIYQNSGLVFMTLISKRPDSQNHMSHLVITRSERAALLETIVASFGDKLEKPDKKYTVAIGQLFIDKLTEFRPFDDPW